MSKRIACLGWGSLIWDRGTLPVCGDWFPHGPALPIEFARLSGDGRVTLVITPHARELPVLWAMLDAPSVREARRLLMLREGSTRPDRIGRWPHKDHDTAEHPVTRLVGDWAVRNGLDGVVWTQLPPRWDGESDRVPTIEQVLGYLRASTTPALAETYVRRTPPQIRTAYRERIEAELGWTPSAA